MINLPIHVGQTARFDPFHFQVDQEQLKGQPTITGKVVLVNATHGLFSVEYQLGSVFRTTFKFSQIGTAVKICK